MLIEILNPPNLIFVAVLVQVHLKTKKHIKTSKKYNFKFKTGNVFDVYPKKVGKSNSSVTNKGPHLGGIFQYMRKYIDEHNQIPEAIITV